MFPKHLITAPHPPLPTPLQSHSKRRCACYDVTHSLGGLTVIRGQTAVKINEWKLLRPWGRAFCHLRAAVPFISRRVGRPFKARFAPPSRINSVHSFLPCTPDDARVYVIKTGRCSPWKNVAITEFSYSTSFKATLIALTDRRVQAFTGSISIF